MFENKARKVSSSKWLEEKQKKGHLESTSNFPCQLTQSFFPAISANLTLHKGLGRDVLNLVIAEHHGYENVVNYPSEKIW